MAMPDPRAEVRWTEASLLERLKMFHDDHYAWNKLQGSPFSGMRKAAILIPLFVQDGTPHVWLTQRSTKLRHDGGDVAFPGGMRDDTDPTESDTALREAHEEIGLEKHQVQVAIQLPPRVNRRGLLVTPVVGIISNQFTPVPNPDEVAVVFHLPLSRFLSEEQHSATPYKNRFTDINVHFFTDDVSNTRITTWGLTAAMCIEMACGLLQRPPDFMYDPDHQLTPSDPFYRQREYLNLYSQFISKM